MKISILTRRISANRPKAANLCTQHFQRANMPSSDRAVVAERAYRIQKWNTSYPSDGISSQSSPLLMIKTIPSR